MRPSVTRVFAVAAALFGGLLAGTTATRALVEMPAWQRVGAVRWAEFARAENHGVGLFFFPAIGLVALLLTAGTAIAFRFDRSVSRSRRLPVYAAVIVSIVGAVVTRGAIVPEMFRMRAASDAAFLQGVLQSITPWWGVNDVLHLLAFAFNLWALTEIVAARPDAASVNRETR
jgi:hypothetical protein